MLRCLIRWKEAAGDTPFISTWLSAAYNTPTVALPQTDCRKTRCRIKGTKKKQPLMVYKTHVLHKSHWGVQWITERGLRYDCSMLITKDLKNHRSVVPGSLLTTVCPWRTQDQAETHWQSASLFLLRHFKLLKVNCQYFRGFRHLCIYFIIISLHQSVGVLYLYFKINM